METWTIKQLYDEMQKDMMSCHTQLEKSMCKTLCSKEIKEKAEKFSKQRKLTPGEIAIASLFGYRG